MALSETQRAQIRMYLGWSGRYLATDGALQRAFNSIETVAAEEAIVTAQLTECIRVDAAITSAEARLKASTVGSIKLNEDEIEQLRDRGRQAVARMARCLGVEVRGDAFSGNLPSHRAGTWGPIGGGGYQMQG